MATIVATSMQGTGVRTVTQTTLTASDTLTFNPGANPILVLRNTTAGALTVTLDGAGGTTVPVVGIGDVSVAAGYVTGSIPATTGLVAIPLNTIAQFLQGAIAVTGGTGITATLLEF